MTPDIVRLQRGARSLCVLFYLAIGYSGWTNPAFADGSRNPFHGAAAMGQGNAFIAQADDPTAVFYNPAGLTRLTGMQTAAGIQLVNAATSQTSVTGVRTENIQHFPIGLPPPGQAFLTVNFKGLGSAWLDDLSTGLGILNLYGFALKYPERAPFAGAVTFAQLPLLSIRPTMAYRITDNLSMGLGASIYTFVGLLGEGHAERRFISSGGLVPAGTNVEVNGKGTTAGLDVSVLYTLFRAENGKPRLNVAAVWRSQAVLPLNGVLLANGTRVADVRTTLTLPETYTIGIAGWPIRNDRHEWKVEFDLDWVRWQTFRQADLMLSNGVTLLNPQQWKNSLSYNAGTEFRWLHFPGHEDWQVALRAGYQFSQTPIQNHDFSASPPDSDVHVLSVGAGFFCSKQSRFLGMIQCGSESSGLLHPRAIGIDIAYQAFLSEPRTVTGATLAPLDGVWHTTIHVGTITARVNF